MREVVVISGKGGTGKTSLTGAFAHLALSKVVCDLDVDAPDLHLLLRPENGSTEEFFSGHVAKIDKKLCSGCGLCASMCRYEAVRVEGNVFSVDPLRCEGCRVCVSFCPEGAILFPEKHCGHWQISSTRFGPLVHARLFPGEANSGRLVTVLKQQARQLAKSEGKDSHPLRWGAGDRVPGDQFALGGKSCRRGYRTDTVWPARSRAGGPIVRPFQNRPCGHYQQIRSKPGRGRRNRSLVPFAGP